MVKNSDTQLAIAIAAATTLTVVAQRSSFAKEDNITKDIPPKVMSITFRFGGLSHEEIIYIFYSKFKPINLHQPRHMRGFHFDVIQDHDWVDIQDEVLQVHRTSGTHKDVGKSFHEVWANAFYKYIIIFVFLFGKETSDLYIALAEFYGYIYKLSMVYDWQKLVLPIAIEIHTFIIAPQPTDSLIWIIREKF